MEKLWTRARDMADVPSVLGGRVLAELGRISSVMQRALGAYERRGPDGRSALRSCHATLAAGRRATYTVGKELPMQAEADAPARATPLARILVIDDERRIVRFVSRGLQAEGYLVDSAENGVDGLRAALDGRYDL